MKELAEHITRLERGQLWLTALVLVNIFLTVSLAMGGIIAGMIALGLLLASAIGAVTFYIRGFRLKAIFKIEPPPQIHIYEGTPDTERVR